MNHNAFDQTKSKIKKEHGKIKEAKFHESSFGSWYITIEAKPDCRLVYDGKENWLLVEQKTDKIFNGIPVWSEVWIAHEPTEADLPNGIRRLIDMK